MCQITKSAYVQKMLPHLLPKRAKKIGITVRDSSQWRKLSESLRYELEHRYDVSSPVTIVKDMSFNKKPLPPTSMAFNYNINDKLVDEMSNIPITKREKIKNYRIDLLDRAIVEETLLHHALFERGIKAYQKMPIFDNGVIFYANLFIPEFNTIIQLIKSNWGKKGLWSKQHKKEKAIMRLGYNVKFAVIEHIANNIGIEALIKEIKSGK